jgi:hypothetical protein
MVPRRGKTVDWGLEAAVAGLERRVGELENRQAILDVYVTYAWLQDCERLDELVDQVFAVDAELSLGTGMPTHRGHDAIRQSLTIRGELEGTAHYFTNFEITVTGDQARARAYFQSFHWTRETASGGPGRPTDFVGAGVYLDEFRREPPGWRITKRERRNLGPGPLGHGQVPSGFARHLQGWGGAVGD